MKNPAAPISGIAASLGQATEYQSEYVYLPQGAPGESQIYGPEAGCSVREAQPKVRKYRSPGHGRCQ